MLGGMSGGGMGFIFDPKIKAQAEREMLDIMRRRKNELALQPAVCHGSGRLPLRDQFVPAPPRSS